MKPILSGALLFSYAVILVLASSLRIEADEALKNGDFSDGINHWSGDGEDVAQVAPDLAAKGMIVKLHPGEWTKVIQEFRPVGSDFDCSITYKLLADTKFSDKEEDYKNVPGHLGFTLWKSFKIPNGDWMMMLSDFGQSVSGTYFPIKPETTADGTATFQTKLVGLSSREDKTITLAFPPGQGSVIIFSVSMTNGAPPVIADTPDFVLSGGDCTIQKLNNGQKAFSNQNYVWQEMPDDLIGKSYTQTALKRPAHLTLHAKNDCTIQVAAAGDLSGWERTEVKFSYFTGKHNTPMNLYQMKISAGQDLVIPEDNLTGALIVLLPN